MDNTQLPVQTDLPMYEQIKRIVLKKIQSNELEPGALIPSERELAAQYGVSRMTARHSITDLENEGYVYRVQGKGAIVSEPKVLESVSDLIGFSEDMRRRGYTPTTRVIEQTIIHAGSTIQKKLVLNSANRDVVLLKRLRLTNDIPMSFETTYLPAQHFGELIDLDVSGSLYELLKSRFQRGPMSATQTIEGEKADSTIATLLGIEEGDVVLRLKRVSFDKDNLPIEYVEAAYRGDKYIFSANLRVDSA